MPRTARPKVILHILPSGKEPKRQTPGSAGYDVHARAVVSTEKDPKNHGIRKVLFDFRNVPKDRKILRHVKRLRKGEFAYRLNSGESVLVGIGFVLAMPRHIYCELDTKSGLVSLKGIDLVNKKGVIDSDFRGEAAALLKNIGHKPFYLFHGMRIAQIIFGERITPRIIPKFLKTDDYAELPKTLRGTGGFGSTGI